MTATTRLEMVRYTPIGTRAGVCRAVADIVGAAALSVSAVDYVDDPALGPGKVRVLVVLRWWRRLAWRLPPWRWFAGSLRDELAHEVNCRRHEFMAAGVTLVLVVR